MKIKISELKQLVREGLARLREDYEVSPNGDVNMEDPVVLWNNTFGMDDQETSTKVANKRINLNLEDPSDSEEVDLAMRTLMANGAMQSEAKKDRKDSNGCETPFAIDKYAKKKSKYKKGKALSMKEALPPQFKKKTKKSKYPDKDGWQGETYKDKQKLKPKVTAKTKAKIKKKNEDKYPDKDGWQGETYKDKQKLKPGKKKKQKSTMAKAKCDEKGFPVKSLKKKKKGTGNPFALSHYTKNK